MTLLHTPPEPIAVVGTACRFPGSANSPSKLWEILKSPQDLSRKPPKERFPTEAFYHPDNSHHGTSNVQDFKSYFLEEDVSLFDAKFFNISPVEAECMDPQQRLLLETVYDSLCAAGPSSSIDALKGSSTAVFVGMMTDDWFATQTRDWHALSPYKVPGMARSITANRISYFFDWHGSSVCVDTACSSSLVAVHQAVQELRSGTSRTAIAAGVNLILSPGVYIGESKLRMLSPTGTCKMWDKDADGYARGEGVASVVLKTLRAALEDGDHIECIIRETGINQDGKTLGLTMPSSEAQRKLIRDTYRRAGLDIRKEEDRPQFFQAHGTGTKAGDPQEAGAISEAFYPDNLDERISTKKLTVGSVKTVIGHTEGCAGLAGLIAASLAVQHGIIPPNLHFNELNPELESHYRHLEIPLEAKNWPELAPGQPRRASINSFGFGGTNVHAIIEGFDNAKRRPVSNDPPAIPLVFSAASKHSLEILLREHSAFLRDNQDISLQDVAWTLQSRSLLQYRYAVAGSTHEYICSAIDSTLKNNTNALVSYQSPTDPKVLGIFTGQGAQWARMSAKLIELSPFVRERLDFLEKSLAGLPSDVRPKWSIATELLADSSKSKMEEAAYSQPLCTAVQIIQVDLLSYAGIRFDAVVGHSSGEIAAAYAAGFISAEDAIRIAYLRGRYANLAGSPTNGEKGCMMAVAISSKDATEFVQRKEFAGRISVACCNSSSSVTLSGDEDAMDEAIRHFKSNGTFARKLKVDTAYHSAHMHACAPPYLSAMNECGIKYKTPKVTPVPTWYSSVDPGKPMTKDALSDQYWIENMVSTVQFEAALTAATKNTKFDIAVELGPHPALKAPALSVIEAATKAKLPYTGIIARGKDDLEEVASALGFIWAHTGNFIDFTTFDKIFTGTTQTRNFVRSLPSYPFDHQRSFWAETRVTSFFKSPRKAPSPILGRRLYENATAQNMQWRNVVSPAEIPWLNGHRIQGQTVWPASAYVSMAIEAASEIARENESKVARFTVNDIKIDRAMVFNEENTQMEVLFTVSSVKKDENSLQFDFSTNSCLLHNREGTMALNAQGRVTAEFVEAYDGYMPTLQSEDFNMINVDADKFYSWLQTLGYEYAYPFKGITRIQRKLNYATGLLDDQSGDELHDRLILHPGLLDTMVQTAISAFSYPGDGRLWTLHVPTEIGGIVLDVAAFEASRGSSLKFTSWIPGRSLSADVHLSAGEGQPSFLQIQDCKIAPISPATPENDAVLFSNFKYRPAHPEGVLASRGERTSEYETMMMDGLDRLVYYYMRRIMAELTDEEKENALPHFKHFFHWYNYINDLVLAGRHPFVPAGAVNDTEEDMDRLKAKYTHGLSIQVIEGVGKNLANLIRENSKSGILEYMREDGLLERLYEEGIGLKALNGWVSRIVGQIAHRYPHMKIFEVGAGTGGVTSYILPQLGTSFTSYTYTDISSGYFEIASKRFQKFNNRMLFKTFDMEADPTTQDFTPGTYDLVVASNVLHASGRMHDVMQNIRKLLKPGGFLVALEFSNNEHVRLSVSFPFVGLPGWWAGADEDRPLGPGLPLNSWDTLLKDCGFSGIDTTTPDHDLLPMCVFVSQAVDERVTLLREPCTPESWKATENKPVFVIAGHGNPVGDEVVKLLKTPYPDLVTIPSVENIKEVEISSDASIVCLTELEDPYLRDFSEAKLDALKALWNTSANILWISRGAKAHEPYSYMMLGLRRCLENEYEGTKFNILDFDHLDSSTPETIVQELQRMILARSVFGLENIKQKSDLLWSIESEVFIEHGREMITRLYSDEERNERYNAEKRNVVKEMKMEDGAVEMVHTGESITFKTVSPLKITDDILGEKEDFTPMYSLAHPLRLDLHNSSMLYLGTDHHGRRAIALSNSTTLPIQTASVPLPNALQGEPAEILLTIAAQFIAGRIKKSSPAGSKIAVHDAHPALKGAIKRLPGMRVVFTASRSDFADGETILLQPNRPVEFKQKKALQEARMLFDFSSGLNAAMKALVGRMCTIMTKEHFLGTGVQGIAEDYTDELLAAVDLLSTSEITFYEPAVIPINALPQTLPSDVFTVLNFTAAPIPVSVQPIDEGRLFRDDGTYFLVGLTGDIGQSLCQWMVEHGAKHVVLASRNPKVSEKYIDAMAELGADVRIVALDITSKTSLQAAYDSITATMPPIIGVANGTLILKDTIFDKMTITQWNQVIAPKVTGTALLDELFGSTPLDFFIVLSSISLVAGARGQSNYVAANAFMTGLINSRRRRGLTGSVVHVSSIVGLGYLERAKLDPEHFLSLGFTNMSERDFLVMFAETVAAGRAAVSSEQAEVVTGFATMYRDELKNLRAPYREELRFGHLLFEFTHRHGAAETASDAAVALRELLSSANTTEERLTIVKTFFMAFFARMMRLPSTEDINETAPLAEQGMDSLVALEIRSWFKNELGVEVGVMRILSGGSVSSLAEEVCGKLNL